MLFKRNNSLLSETPFTVNPVNSLDSFGGHVDSDALCVSCHFIQTGYNNKSQLPMEESVAD